MTMTRSSHRQLIACTMSLIAALLAGPRPAYAQFPGDLDALDAGMVGDYVFATTVQPDGKIILAGSFTSVLGQPRHYLARLNADGTLDAAFDPNPDVPVYSVALQADGKILVGGDFTSLQPNGAASPTTR
ncbi:MAG: delta-60 repeat domain-containing protein, partial [Vicinamibacteria bacterium]|nr:delta-60 repeat domain-containing protein [Vicinamibacteria bacterium]